MVNFPIIESLAISDYGLFPGSDEEPGLAVKFNPGLTLVLGANGLGKTTLVTILYRLLTGPFDIPALEGRKDVGTARLRPTRLPPRSRRMLADRVSDSAKGATATLLVSLGSTSVEIQRNLGTLRLTGFVVDGEDSPTSEANFQDQIRSLAGVWSFGDWILMLRHMVFYFEDRRALVWDPSAQRQILRFLFLQPKVAKSWTEKERSILELDTEARNLSAAVYKVEQTLAVAEADLEPDLDIREELRTLESLQEAAHEERDALDQDLLEHDELRQRARLNYMELEQRREEAYRDLERARLVAIEARFPSTSDSAKYILAQLIAERECLACGSDVPEFAETLERRLETRRCVVCGEKMTDRNTRSVPASEIADRRVKKRSGSLDKIESDLESGRGDLEAAEEAYGDCVEALAALDRDIATRSNRIDHLLRRLPPNESEMHQQREELARLRARAAMLKASANRKRAGFQRFINNRMKTLFAQSESVKEKFEEFACGFLLENCQLHWSPQKARLGQVGQQFDFPAFQLDLGAASFSTPVRRSGPEQVSESQREFIDLAFRMALIAVAGSNNAGTLVIDAPESSLDAVFVNRAANVLARFAAPRKGNRLVVTSNLTDGNLIPLLLQKAARGESRRRRLVDLLEIAEPTAAVRQHQQEYRRVINKQIGPLLK